MNSQTIDRIFSQCKNSSWIKKIDNKKISEDGFLSAIYQANLHCGDPTVQETVIVKIPDGSKIRGALEKVTGKVPTEDDVKPHLHALEFFFNRELDFYSMKPLPDIPLPYVYYCKNGDNILAMEDLSSMKIVPYYDSLSPQQVEAVGAKLLDLHTFSLTMAPEWSAKFKYPRQLLDSISSFGPMIAMFVEKHPILADSFEKLKKAFSDKAFLGRMLCDAHTEFGVPSFLCHGDLWSYNIMWHPTDEGGASRNIGKIIDWQNVHIGNICEDYAHLMTFNCDPEVRRKMEKEHLPAHYARLRLRASCARVDFEMTCETFIRCYKRTFVAHTLAASFILSTMLTLKSSTDDKLNEKRVQCILKRILANWEDAIVILKREYPEYSLE